MEDIAQATEEELKISRTKCWTCHRKARVTDWTGWNMCLVCWRNDYKWGRGHGLWRALKDLKLKTN